MPPPPQKGTGKKGRDRDVRQSRSRNTTPSLTGSSLPPSAGSGSVLASGTTPFLNLPVSSFRTLEDAIENYGSTIPSYRDLEALLNQLNVLADVVDAREEVCDKGMRLMAKERKDRMEEIEGERVIKERERGEEVEREREREREKDRERDRERGKKKGEKGEKRKRRDAEGSGSAARDRDGREERERHGGHAQDGNGKMFDIATPARDKKPVRQMSRDNDSASSSLSPAPAVTTPAATGPDNDDRDDDDSSADEHQPAAAPAVPHLQTFGDDPSTFPDPTIYEIRPVTPGMSDDMKKEIYSVAVFPKNNLEDMIPGPTPDMDFSNAKPSNQVQFNTFSTYIDPYFRPFTEEDLAFLRERGDRVHPYIIPRRGKRHYTEIWAEEDGTMSADGPQQGRDKLPLNQPRGSIEQMDDNTAETDQISAGPVLSRLLATLRPEHRAAALEEKPTINGLTNGEASVNGESNGDLEVSAPLGDNPTVLPSATQMPGSNDDAWKKATHHKLDYAQVDERIKQELRHIGFLLPDTEPDYDAHYDDETAQRLRVLQEMLKARAIKNGAMKARLMELTREQMAHQEFNTILEDLDDQVKTAYLKRTRTLGKSKKAKRPGGAGGGSHFVAGDKGVGSGMARPGIGDLTKMIMEKRRKWNETVGPVLDPEAGKVRRSTEEGSGIFGEEVMRDHIRREQEAWDEAMEDE